MKLIGRIVFLVVLVISFSGIVRSQESAVIKITERNIRDALGDIKARSIEMERIRKSSGRRARNSERAFPAIRRDFEKIQRLNTEKIQKRAVAGKITEKQLRRTVREIRRRSIRLDSALFRMDHGEGKQNKEFRKGVEPLGSLMIMLDNAIRQFVTNPIFRNTRVVSPDHSLKAHQDLHRVISISEAIIGRTGPRD